jgi:hypothetical protein
MVVLRTMCTSLIPFKRRFGREWKGVNVLGQVDRSAIRPHHVRFSANVMPRPRLRSSAASCFWKFRVYVQILWPRQKRLNECATRQSVELTVIRFRMPGAIWGHHLVNAFLRASSRFPFGLSHATNSSSLGNVSQRHGDLESDHTSSSSM